MRTIRWMGLAVVGLMTGCYEDPVIAPNGPEATVFVATGTATVDEFTSALGASNGGTSGDQLTGRREISWDGAAADPFNNRNDFLAGFFNTNVTVGAVYTTDGTGLRNDSVGRRSSIDTTGGGGLAVLGCGNGVKPWA